MLSERINWQATSSEVNSAIHHIELDYLRSTVRRLKEETSSVLELGNDLPNRGHNNPPELIETDEDAKSAITFIWADLDFAGRELDQVDPDLSALKRIGQTLVNGAAKVLAYIGQKADLAINESVKETSKTGTKWLITVMGVDFISKLEAIQKAGASILQFAERLAQGAGLM